MTRFALPWLGALIGALLLFGACGSDDEPAVLSDTGRPTGEAIYQATCASCHGSDLRGTDKGPAQLSIVYEPNHHGDDAYRSAIRNGAPQHHWSFGDMAPIEGIDDDEIERVIAFIRSQQDEQGFER